MPTSFSLSMHYTTYMQRTRIRVGIKCAALTEVFVCHLRRMPRHYLKTTQCHFFLNSL